MIFFTWISEVRQLSNQVERLEISSSMFMQCFFWENMSDMFKKQFMAVTNSARPSLDNIIDKALEVEKRMKTMSFKSGRSNYNTVALDTKVDHFKAPNSDSKSKRQGKNIWLDVKNSCALCNSLNDKPDANHEIFNCKNFLQLKVNYQNWRSYEDALDVGF